LDTTHRILSTMLIICILTASFVVNAAFALGYPQEGIVWEFNSSEAVDAANSAVATAACGKITADTEFVNSYDICASFTTNATRRMQIKLPNNVIQQKNESGEYVYSYLHILVGNPQSEDVTFGCGINTTSSNTQVTLPANSWTVASFYIEDLFLAGNSNYKRDGKNYGESVQGVAFQMSDQIAGANTSNAEIKYNLDKIWVTAQPLPSFELDGISPENGYGSLSPVDAEVRFNFKRNLKPVSTYILPEAFVPSDGTPVDAMMEVKGKSLFVKANDLLSMGSSYTLNLDGVSLKDCYGEEYSKKLTYSFSTLKNNVVSGTISATDENGNEVFSLSDGGSVDITARAMNVSSSAETAVIAVTSVNRTNGEAVFMASSSCELPPDTSSAAELEKVNLSVDGNTDVYALAVNNLNEAYPLAPAYFALTCNENTSGMVYKNYKASAEVTLNEPAMSVDTMTISGKCEAGSLVVVGIRSITDGELKYLMPLEALSDGSFSTDYIFSNAQSGKYKVFAVTYGNSDIAECEIVYLGEGTKEEIRGSFDDDIDTDAALTLLNRYRDGMGIPSAYTDKQLRHIAAVLCEQKPYGTYSDVINTANDATDALELLNDASWSSYSKCFEDYSIILNNDESLSEYFEHDTRGRAEIHKLAAEKSPFGSFCDIRDALAEAEKAYTKKLSENKKPSGGSSSRPSGGGGGFSGGGVSISPSGTNIKESADAPVADTFSGNAEFTDVTGEHWAYNALNELTKRNIISGYADGTFRGDNSVSRAEFVKILTGVFGFAEGKETKFSDVPSGAWYEEFLSRASFAGIVKGNDGCFMPDECITRQDASLMLYRSLQYKNISLSGTKNFSDSGDISDYAFEAVSKMGASLLVSGYADGSFAPDRSITRFEAVQLLYNTMKYISGGAQ